MTPDAFLNKLQQKRLLVKTRKRSMHKGLSQSNAFGSSIEFSDFRVYQPGDDVRQIDWNVYGRTGKHYIKRFLDEQEISIAVYLDMSPSMRTYPQKWETARMLAATLSYMILSSEDRLSFIPVSVSNGSVIRRKGAIYRKKVYSEILSLKEKERTAPFFEQLLESFLNKGQLSILLSDGLEPIEIIEATLKKLRSTKQEIWFFQLLAEEELTPNFQGDVKLIDSELATVVNVSMNRSLIEDYEQKITKHNQQIAEICQSLGIRYVLIPTERAFQTIILQDLPRQRFMN